MTASGRIHDLACQRLQDLAISFARQTVKAELPVHPTERQEVVRVTCELACIGHATVAYVGAIKRAHPGLTRDDIINACDRAASALTHDICRREDGTVVAGGRLSKLTAAVLAAMRDSNLDGRVTRLFHVSSGPASGRDGSNVATAGAEHSMRRKHANSGHLLAYLGDRGGTAHTVQAQQVYTMFTQSYPCRNLGALSPEICNGDHEIDERLLRDLKQEIKFLGDKVKPTGGGVLHLNGKPLTEAISHRLGLRRNRSWRRWKLCSSCPT